MNKETFVKLMNVLEKHYKKDTELINLLERDMKKCDRGDELFPFNGEFLRNGKLYDDLIKTIQEAVGDTSEWITYYIWELDWGVKNRMDTPDRYCVTDKDGKDVPISTPEELYDCIKNV